MNLFYLFTMFLRIGLFGFGGGMAMLPLIFQSVQAFGLMTPQEFSDLVALSQMTPGPIAVNAATYIGFNTGGIPGALIATFGVCVPSFLLVLIIMKFTERFQGSKGLQGAFYGIRPVTVGLIAAAAIFVAETSLVKGELFSRELLTAPLEYINLPACFIFTVTLILAGKLKISPIKITILMGITGALICG